MKLQWVGRTLKSVFFLFLAWRGTDEVWSSSNVQTWPSLKVYVCLVFRRKKGSSNWELSKIIFLFVVCFTVFFFLLFFVNIYYVNMFILGIVK